MGAKIAGIGSHMIEIEGVESLKGCRHSVIPDRIEAATYILAAAVTNGKILVRQARSDHLGAFLNVMSDCGINVGKRRQGGSLGGGLQRRFEIL